MLLTLFSVLVHVHVPVHEFAFPKSGCLFSVYGNVYRFAGHVYAVAVSLWIRNRTLGNRMAGSDRESATLSSMADVT